MTKKGKIWGDTECIFSNGIVSVHFLDIKKGGYCSEHCHKQKTNRFYVIKGDLEISVWEDKTTCDKTILRAGQSTVIPFDVWHKFRAITDVECIEVYEVKSDGDDIERRTQGGILYA